MFLTFFAGWWKDLDSDTDPYKKWEIRIREKPKNIRVWPGSRSTTLGFSQHWKEYSEKIAEVLKDSIRKGCSTFRWMLDDMTGATVVFSEMPTFARTSIDMYKQAVSKIVRHFRRSWQAFILGSRRSHLGVIFKQAGSGSSDRAGTHTDRMANSWTGWHTFRQDGKQI